MDEIGSPAGTARAGSRLLSELLTLPNLLSLARILLTPVFVLMMVRRTPWAAFAVFLAAGATDALDGFAARQLRLKTTLGLWLDPIGDKLLLTAAFVVLTLPALAAPNALPLWLTALCIGRDVAISLGALVIVALRGKRRFPPTLAGKASTICQVLLIYVVLYLNAAGRTPQSLAWFYVLTALLTAGSFVQYGFIGVRMLRGPRAS
ncbi:MAG TPA: CDP-alcohol phosphatidyltransferase family protein [Candidatus Aminicenantes bacterium]|nr:CDP-alcohol phosphatidyltransferase family protein [Candidatus Aminicenantes bacterium]HRY63753.1 CDP-alcohol phosphatidyltransferase family protein [Candidatus Aminicenantes bacterium]HRZ70666.1 CDP-alcohol phosphatidyltransferase family protein [Candidatus Aminicenantes bacterium]